MSTTSALMIARTTSVGRRDLGSSCADANNWSPSDRVGGGCTVPLVLSRGCAGVSASGRG